MNVSGTWSMFNTGIIILAAGSSSRLGTPKQLLPFRQNTLLRHMAQEAVASGAGPVLVVLGAQAERIDASLAGSGAISVFNPDWEQGKASSIVTGVRHMLQVTPEIRNLIVAVCDQPFVAANLFVQLIEKQLHTGKHMIASAYAGTLGTPVLFTKPYFEDLLALKADEGAKQLLVQHPDAVERVEFPLGHIDIDTQADYENLVSKLPCL